MSIFHYNKDYDCFIGIERHKSCKTSMSIFHYNKDYDTSKGVTTNISVTSMSIFHYNKDYDLHILLFTMR